MEFGAKLKELNMTTDEVERFSAAFKDEQFRGLLLDYAKELSDPENKKKYEEEIKLLEEERGNAIEFIHPQPFRALKTSVNGKQKCFVNICTNEKVGKCEFKWGVSEEGKRGQHWSLPHSLHPGRPERDPKGNKFMIYDVIFHPDTIHMASRNREFMDMVDSTAIQGIQDGFKVRLDQNNVKVLATKYKGAPQPCVVRKPIPGYQAEDPPASPDPLAFPFPDEDPPSRAANQPAAGAKTTEESTPRSFVTESPKPGAPTTPHYTLKYRSFIDLQDFRCSRDSAQSPRPGAIVVTVDMPLLKSAKDTSLEVLGKTLRVESKRPAYRLELPLAYPVDEDSGEAKFNTQNGQLTITLPVPPLVQTLDLTFGAGLTGREDETGGEGEGEVIMNEQSEEDEEGDWKESKLKSEATQNGEVQNRRSELDKQEELEKEETELQRERADGRERERAEAREDGGCDTEAQAGNPRRNDVPTTHVASYTEDNPSEPADNRNGVQPHTQKSVKHLEDNTGENSGTSESSFHSRNSLGTEVDEETGTHTGTKVDTGSQGNTGTCAEKEHLQGTSSTESQYTFSQLVSGGKSSSEATGLAELLNSEDRNHQMILNVPKASAEDQLKKEGSADAVLAGPVSTTEEEQHQEDSADAVLAGPVSTTEEEQHQEDSADAVPAGPVSTTEEEEHQEGSPPGQSGSKPVFSQKPPQPLLREMDESGQETIISDHATSAGLSFHNSLLYELD